MIDRRGVCLGTAASLFATDAPAAPPDPLLFASGPLARNALAMTFKAPSAPLKLPGTEVIGEQGLQRFPKFQGRTHLVSLWAEWCAPCLAEAGDLAALGAAFSGPSFELVFVLTGSEKKLDFPGARAVLAKYGAGGAPLLAEPNGGSAVMDSLATHVFEPQLRAAIKRDSGPSLPCNLLIDRHGRVRGRSFGTVSTSNASHEGPMTAADKDRLLRERTTWSTPAGREFVAALAAGVLEKG